jgi:hypothetical protein
MTVTAGQRWAATAGIGRRCCGMSRRDCIADATPLRPMFQLPLAGAWRLPIVTSSDQLSRAASSRFSSSSCSTSIAGVVRSRNCPFQAAQANAPTASPMIKSASGSLRGESQRAPPLGCPWRTARVGPGYFFGTWITMLPPPRTVVGSSESGALSRLSYTRPPPSLFQIRMRNLSVPPPPLI